MTMPPEKVGVLVITAVIAILVSVTLLNSPERSDRDRDAAWGRDAFDDLEADVDDFEFDELRDGQRRTRIAESYRKRLDNKKPVAPVQQPRMRHRVRKGETLGAVARKYYGKSSLWPLIVRANPGLAPKRVRAGIDIVIPSLEGRRRVGRPSGRSPGASSSSSGGEWYKVARGDNLERIARKKLGKRSAWRDIYAANRSRIKDAAVIREGQRLLIPVLQ